MSRRMLVIESLYGSTIEDLKFFADSAKSNYSRDVLQTVIQRYNGIPTQAIANNLSKSPATIASYINRWNTKGIAGIVDHRGNNIPSALTEDMLENICEIVKNNSPHDFGYEQNRWNSSILKQYIHDTYGPQYSISWISKLLKSLGFSYKRGVYKPTKGDEELQQSFKKKCPHCWKLSRKLKISPFGSLTKLEND